MSFDEDLWTVLTYVSLILCVSIWFSTGQQIILVSCFTFFLLLPAFQPCTACWYFDQRQFSKLKGDENYIVRGLTALSQKAGEKAFCSHPCKVKQSSQLTGYWKNTIELSTRRSVRTFLKVLFHFSGCRSWTAADQEGVGDEEGGSECEPHLRRVKENRKSKENFLFLV